MKLVITIISNADVERVSDNLSKEGFFATKISTTGQFLIDGHTALLIGCDDDKTEGLYDILKNSVTKRVVRSTGVTSTIAGSLLKQAVDVEEYGGVAFTLDVDSFQKF